MDFSNLHGFSITGTRELPELSAVLYQMTHDKTGLELVWVKRDEENKTFGIAFETLPWNDTGVFHILEHSVLCGSDKYPVKEPFVELMKSSMNTFLNALTFPDKTVYPISSRNDKDFINLMRVYLDAVFCPSIYSKPEIFYQEGWHYELDESGQASYKGVVFNEMKGAFASADTLVDNEINRLLFPDSPYGYVSGGDPAVIPTLTYEEFLDSHRRFYSPSNAYVFLDGDLDIEKVLGILNDEYLSGFEKTERIAPPAVQAPVSGESEGFYELAPGEDPDGKTRLTYGKVISLFSDREKLVASQVLADVLCGTNQSPLPKAILAAGYAEEVNMGVSDGIMQPLMMLDIKNIKDENIPALEELIRAQLTSLAENGLDHLQLEAVMANTEFKLRERDYGYYPQGLVLGFGILESWLYGGDPAANLEVGDLFVGLKRKMADGYFENLIREILLDNPHSARVILRPSVTVGEERRAAEQARADSESSAWTAEERQAVAERQEKLLSWQNSEDTPEVLATIPQLSKEDIPTEPEKIPTEETVQSGITVLEHDLNTSGIVYVNMYFDADGCTEDDLSYLSFASSLLGQTATRTHSADEILNSLRLLCGDFGVSPAVFVSSEDPTKTFVKLSVGFSALESNLDAALKLIIEILTESVASDDASHDILRQAKMQLFQQVVMSGNAVALGRVNAQLFPSGVAGEYISGIKFYDWLKKQDENWDFASLSAGMTGVLESVINRTGLVIGVTGADGSDIAAALAKLIPEKPVAPKAEIKPWGLRKEGIIIPADISFAVVGGNLTDNGGTFDGHVQLAGQIISLAYLWNVIRVQGGAYGTGMVTRNTGLTACYSYRDPDCSGSIGSYAGCAEFLRDFAAQETDFTGFMIGAVANASPLMTPRVKGQTGDSLYFTGTTWESRCRRRAELLSTTSDDLVAIADALEKTISGGGICVVGGQDQIDGCEDLENIITL